jgi:hypothetical protein
VGDLPVIQGGATALLALVVWFILTGRLVPRSVLDDVRRDRDVRVAEAREEAAEWQAAAKVSASQVDTLLPEMQTHTALLKALQPKEKP